MRYDIDKIKKECIGKWRGIFSALGVLVPENPKDHGPCPICGAGNNGHRFRFDDRNGSGSWICNQCGSGDGWAMVQLKFGWTFIDSVARVNEIVGTVEFEPSPKEEDASKKRERMNSLWKSSKPIDGGDCASKYLRSRGIAIGADPTQVRYCLACPEPETMSTMRAMVAMVRDNKTGDPIGMHRTYLSDDFKKADLKSPKKSIGKMACGSIRLMPVTDTVGIAEGIETALSASQLFDIPCWSSIDAGGMESFFPPDGVRKVVIFGDNDANFKGQSSAYRLANKLYLKDFLVDDPQIPDTRGDDWNDVLMKQLNRNGQ